MKLDDAKLQLHESFDYAHLLRTYIQDYMKDHLRKVGLANFLYNTKWITDYDVDDPSLSMAHVPITDKFKLDYVRFADIAKRAAYLKEVLAEQFTEEEITIIYVYYFEEDDPSLTKQEKIDRIITEKMAPDIDKKISVYEDLTGKKLADTIDDVARWDSEHKRYIDGKKEYEEKLTEYNEGVEKFKASQQELEDARNKYYSGLKQYEDGYREYNNSVILLAEKEEEYAKAQEEYQANLDKLNKYKEMVNKLDGGRWLPFSVLQSGSYLSIDSISNNFSSISMTFSLLFVFVGALVIYATVGKIIEEQRTMVGTTKALGFFNYEIFIKYLGFALSAVLIGTFTGIFLSHSILQRIFVDQAIRFFHLGEGMLHFSVLDAAIVVLLAVILSVAAVWFACMKLIRTPVKDLMVPEVPKTKKKSGSSSHGSLYSRLIVRNMVSDPKRVIVTIVSIAGCCALLVIGFTVRHAIVHSNEVEYEELIKYDYHVKYNSSTNENVEGDIESVLDSYNLKYARSSYYSQGMIVDGKIAMTSLICMDFDEVADFYAMNDPKTSKPLDHLEDGIYCTIKQDDNYGIAPGTKVTYLDEKLKEKQGNVVGFYECYASNVMMISDKAYKETFGYDCAHNRYLFYADESMVDDIERELMKINGVTGLFTSQELRAQSESFISIANFILVILTFMAIVMAYFIIFNLTNTYIQQRRRELTVMRINGFTVNEVVKYVSTEMYLTSALGIVLGWFLGALIGRKIVIMIENHSLYIRDVYLPGWALASFITVLFTVVIIRTSLRKVRYLKLTDI